MLYFIGGEVASKVTVLQPARLQGAVYSKLLEELEAYMAGSFIDASITVSKLMRLDKRKWKFHKGGCRGPNTKKRQ